MVFPPYKSPFGKRGFRHYKRLLVMATELYYNLKPLLRAKGSVFIEKEW